MLTSTLEKPCNLIWTPREGKPMEKKQVNHFLRAIWKGGGKIMSFLEGMQSHKYFDFKKCSKDGFQQLLSIQPRSAENLRVTANWLVNLNAESQS